VGADERPTTADIATRAAPHPLAEAEPQTDEETTLQPLLGGAETNEVRDRWQSIQTDFVDDPRESVEQADALVAELMQRLAQIFTEERRRLEAQWTRGDDVSTEDLRLALRRYRSFFERLLST
jgi:hypothetical protein